MQMTNEILFFIQMADLPNILDFKAPNRPVTISLQQKSPLSKTTIWRFNK